MAYRSWPSSSDDFRRMDSDDDVDYAEARRHQEERIRADREARRADIQARASTLVASGRVRRATAWALAQRTPEEARGYSPPSGEAGRLWEAASRVGRLAEDPTRDDSSRATDDLARLEGWVDPTP